MNRTLKRPMFRMGGSSATGITSGLDTPRASYQFGGGAGMAADNIRLSDLPFMKNQMASQSTEGNVTSDASSLTGGQQLLKAFENREKANNLSNFLINFGLNLASATPRGKGITGTFATAAEAAKQPFGQFTKDVASEKAFDRELNLAATKMDINERLKKEAEDRTLKRTIEAEDRAAKTAEEVAKTQFERDLELLKAKPVKKTYRIGVDTKTGKRGFFTDQQIEESKGSIQPVDNRMAFRFNANTNSFEQIPLSDVEQGKEDEITARNIGTQFNILSALTDDMKTRIPDTATGFTGNFFAFVEGSADQFRQLGESLGIRDGLVIKDEGVIDQYLKDKGFTQKASDFATMKGSVINLGYALAKIAEPDNPRLSEGDIIRQLNRINFGSSRKVFADSLDQILREENIRASTTIKGFKLDPNNFIGTKIKTDKDVKDTDGSNIDQFKFINGVLHKKVNGEFTKDF